jgi:hypothetical protein
MTDRVFRHYLIVSFLLTLITSPSSPGQGVAGNSGFDKILQRELLKMGKEDQRHRNRMMSLMKQGLKDPKVQKRFIEITRAQDTIDLKNMSRLREIIQKHGWPGVGLVGREASSAAFLLLQHAELSDQKTYFPMLKAAAEKYDASIADSSMLEDRILMREAKPQVYGTQLSTNHITGKLELWPIAEEESVDSRRAAVGLPPLAQYLKFFGLQYTPPKR